MEFNMQIATLIMTAILTIIQVIVTIGLALKSKKDNERIMRLESELRTVGDTHNHFNLKEYSAFEELLLKYRIVCLELTEYCAKLSLDYLENPAQELLNSKYSQLYSETNKYLLDFDGAILTGSIYILSKNIRGLLDQTSKHLWAGFYGIAKAVEDTDSKGILFFREEVLKHIPSCNNDIYKKLRAAIFQYISEKRKIED